MSIYNEHIALTRGLESTLVPSNMVNIIAIIDKMRKIDIKNKMNILYISSIMGISGYNGYNLENTEKGGQTIYLNRHSACATASIFNFGVSV